MYWPTTGLETSLRYWGFLVTDPLRQGELNLPKRFSLPVRDGDKELTLNRQSYDAWLMTQQQQQTNFVNMMDKLSVETRFVDAGRNLNQQIGALR